MSSGPVFAPAVSGGGVAPVWQNLTLSADYVNHGGGWGEAKYMVDGNTVFLSGMVILVTAGLWPSPSVVGTLPTGARPTTRKTLSFTASQVGFVRLDVETNGEIVVSSTGGGLNGTPLNYVSLYNIQVPLI
jgi:hypothetical protein